MQQHLLTDVYGLIFLLLIVGVEFVRWEVVERSTR
jgi:hypothetical protein